MSDTPFRDRAREIARTKDYVTMEYESGRARSQAWWRRLVEHGPWGSGYNTGRVGPPDREALDGIADLFGTSPERVAEMVAADWYHVRIEREVSDRVLELSHVLDALSDEDTHLIWHIALRLADEGEEILPAA